MINLNYRDSRPIYEQIKEGLKNLVVTGVMSEGERLPSVRELATQLAINPNTIQRAYRELESEGYIYSIAGKGSFVSAGVEVPDMRKNELFEELDRIVRELKFLGAGNDELISRIEGGEQDD